MLAVLVELLRHEHELGVGLDAELARILTEAFDLGGDADAERPRQHLPEHP